MGRAIEATTPPELTGPTAPVNIAELHARAKAKLTPMVYGYFASGADDQQTLEDNEEGFRRLRFRPRVLVDVSNANLMTEVLGVKISFPLIVAPTAMQRMAHPEGELATSRAVAKAGTIMGLSSWSTTSLEDVANEAPGAPRWFQLYVYKDREVVKKLVQRAEKAGYKAIALTVDTPRLGRREADIKNQFNLPSHLTMANFTDSVKANQMKNQGGSGLASYVASLIDRSLSWKDIEWLRSITKMPILAKGIVTAEDTVLAIQHGCAGIIVSNHGARQLDGVVSTIDALEEVVQAAQGRVPVFVDSGVRRGTDIVKALALGAKGVLIGRPVVWGLSVAGEAGITWVLDLLKNEFDLAMSLCGCVKVSDITRDLVIRDSFAPYDVRRTLPPSKA